MADQLLRSFQFHVTLRRSATIVSGQARSSERSNSLLAADGAFQECSGLEVEMDVQEYLEGGRNDGVIKRVGRAKYSAIVLKRGMFYSDGGKANSDLWQWLQNVVKGVRPVERYDGTITVMKSREDPGATWTFDRGLPLKIRGPELNAKTGEVAVEELHIAHEGLRLE
jgi:phage tail-like protein